jgi:hypothetical protein
VFTDVNLGRLLAAASRNTNYLWQHWLKSAAVRRNGAKSKYSHGIAILPLAVFALSCHLQSAGTKLYNREHRQGI